MAILDEVDDGFIEQVDKISLEEVANEVEIIEGVGLCSTSVLLCERVREGSEMLSTPSKDLASSAGIVGYSRWEVDNMDGEVLARARSFGWIIVRLRLEVARTSMVRGTLVGDVL